MCADDCAVTPLLAAAFNNHLDTCVVLIRDNCLLDVVGEFKLRSDERHLTALQVPYARYLLTYSNVLQDVPAFYIAVEYS